MDYDEVAPDASAMIESMRAYGYTLATAIADIIDNSLSANCKNVWLSFQWNSGDPWISISDDGKGMSESELVNAMRLGSTNPLEERNRKDLGRFGLGLKTASFSQARRLTVVSLQEKGITAKRRWDLDHLAKPGVKGWQLLKTIDPGTKPKASALKKHKLKSGTIVILEILDRVLIKSVESESDAEKHWAAEVARTREHLEMVFHRFLSGENGTNCKIFFNKDKLKPWDPFCRTERATQKEAEDYNTELGGKVTLTGYILPHRDRFDSSDRKRSIKLHQQAAGPAGWNAQQGFYLYRNRRLIIPGNWFGLGPGQNGWKKEEHYKLARIQVDIPNSMDQEWQIDVRKSTAFAPSPLRSWLTGLAKTCREKAKDVYSHRGGRIIRKSKKAKPYHHPWLTKTKKDGTFNYLIDRKHELYDALVSAIPSSCKNELETLLRLIEETVPVQRIWIDSADNQDGVAQPFEGETNKKLKKHIETCYEALLSIGKNTDDAMDAITVFPAFQTKDAQALIGQMKE